MYLVMSVLPKYSVSTLMGYLKGKPSLRLFRYMTNWVKDTGEGIFGQEDIV